MERKIATASHFSWVAGMLALVVAFSGCEGMPPIPGSGNIATETRQVQDFSGLRLTGGAEVTYTIAERVSCEIQADDNLLPLIRTEVRNEILKIDYEGTLQPSEPIRIQLSGPPLGSVGIVGSGKFSAPEVDSNRFDFSVTGSGQGEVKGSTKSLKVQISGSGKLNAPQLVCSDASVAIAGSGTADIHAESSLKVSITGSGSVSYSGSAESSSTIVGSGKVTPALRSNPDGL